MGVEDTIKQKLENYGIADHGYKPGLMKHLIKIEAALVELDDQFKTADQNLKDSRPNVKKISRMSGVSRQTFYNNPILGEYVECAAEEQIRNDPYEMIEKLRAELDEQKAKIQKMMDRDADIALYKAMNEELEEETRSLRATIESQQELLRNAKVQETTGKVKMNKGRIVSLPH